MSAHRPMIDSPRGRPVKEWVGKRPDSMPPPSIRLRVFDRWEGRCHITGEKIQIGDKWDLDHIKRLADGGENRESNLAPALRKSHQDKTADETRRGRDADRARIAHLGIKPAPARKLVSRGFVPSAKAAGRAAKLSMPPRRHIYGKAAP